MIKGTYPHKRTVSRPDCPDSGVRKRGYVAGGVSPGDSPAVGAATALAAAGVCRQGPLTWRAYVGRGHAHGGHMPTGATHMAGVCRQGPLTWRAYVGRVPAH